MRAEGERSLSQAPRSGASLNMTREARTVDDR